MQGNLQEFGLAEILQLVAMQHKTGLLRVESYDKLLTFYFDRGTLVSCRDRRRIADDPLVEYMKRSGFLDAWQTLHLTLEVEENRRDLAEVLLEKKLLTEEELQVALEDMPQELAFRTYNWKEGTYRFLGGEESLRGLSHVVSLKMEAVLLEAARRVDEWPQLLTRLPTPQVLLAPVATLPATLDERSHALLSRLRTPMRLAELVGVARIPEYDVYEIVVAALDTGITKVLEAPRLAEPAPTPATAPAKEAEPKNRTLPRLELGAGRPPRPGLIYWALVLLVAGSTLLALGARTGRTRTAQAEVEDRVARQALTRAIEGYRALQGRYPESLQELASFDLVTPPLVAKARVSAYAPGPHGQEYELTYLGAAEPASR